VEFHWVSREKLDFMPGVPNYYCPAFLDPDWEALKNAPLESLDLTVGLLPSFSHLDTSPEIDTRKLMDWGLRSQLFSWSPAGPLPRLILTQDIIRAHGARILRISELLHRRGLGRLRFECRDPLGGVLASQAQALGELVYRKTGQPSIYTPEPLFIPWHLVEAYFRDGELGLIEALRHYGIPQSQRWVMVGMPSPEGLEELLVRLGYTIFSPRQGWVGDLGSEIIGVDLDSFTNEELLFIARHQRVDLRQNHQGKVRLARRYDPAITGGSQIFLEEWRCPHKPLAQLRWMNARVIWYTENLVYTDSLKSAVYLAQRLMA
jgi:hypothetical protein